MAIAKEQLRQIIKENDLTSAGDVYALLKDSFKDLLQEFLEAELDVSLVYDKNEKHGISALRGFLGSMRQLKLFIQMYRPKGVLSIC